MLIHAFSSCEPSILGLRYFFNFGLGKLHYMCFPNRGEDSNKQRKQLNAPIFPSKHRTNKEHQFINTLQFLSFI